jgi:hypothetical protein
MKQALILTKDLFFTGKLKAAIQNLPPESGEWSGIFVRSAPDFQSALEQNLGKLELALIDLQASPAEWEQTIVVSRNAGLPVLAFGRHTEPQTLRKARQLGAYKAVPNSTLVEEFPQLLEERGTRNEE